MFVQAISLEKQYKGVAYMNGAEMNETFDGQGQNFQVPGSKSVPSESSVPEIPVPGPRFLHGIEHSASEGSAVDSAETVFARSAAANPPQSPPISIGSPSDLSPTVESPAVVANGHLQPPQARQSTPLATSSLLAPSDEATPRVIQKQSFWGWRTLVAFVAGGLLAGGGFLAARYPFDEETKEAITAQPAQEPVSVDNQEGETPILEGNTAEPAVAVAEALAPAVVQILTNEGSGSGVVYRDNLIITNHHVIDGVDDEPSDNDPRLESQALGEGKVRVVQADGRVLEGEVLGSSERIDIAVVQVEGGDLKVAQLATEDAKVGQTAIAIGAPFQLQQSVTEGIISALNRPIPNRTLDSFRPMIQTDAPINPGNSGGALADSQGRVIGINTSIQTDGLSITNAGVGFAIPTEIAVATADKIVAGEPIEAGFLGIIPTNPTLGEVGVGIDRVTEGTAAEKAGLEVGDRILSVDGAPVTLREELIGLVAVHAPGDIIELEILRGEERLKIKATLDTRPTGE